MGSALKVRKDGKVYDVLLLKGEQGPQGEDGEVSKAALYNNFGNALKGTASGNVIAVDDVSPIEHDVAVTLSSDTVTDFSAITVKRYGKNVFDASVLLQADGWVFDEGYYRGPPATLRNAFNPNTSGQYMFEDFAPNRQYTFSLKGYYNAQEVVSDVSFFFRYRDGSSSNSYLITDGTERSFSMTSEAGKQVVGLFASYSAGFTVHLRDIQLEVGTTTTDYEPYVESTEYSPNEDGSTVVPSLSPSMTLISDTDGVNLDCAYNRDINKAVEKLTNAIISTGGNV